MLELTAKIILYGSIISMAIMAVAKIPVLRTLPIEEREGKRKKSFSLSLKNIKRINRIFCLSLRKKVFSKVKKLKKNSLNKEESEFSDDYWEGIRKR